MTDDSAPEVITGDTIADLARLLERAGIVLPAERIAEVAAEYETFQQQLALVNDTYTAQDEPALIFVAGVKGDKA